MQIHSKALLASKDMDGRQQSATRVLPHPFHIQMSLCKLWVANRSLASTPATRFATVAAGLRSVLSRNVDPFKGAPGQSGHEWQAVPCHRSVATSFLYNTQMSLHKLWIANHSPASTSATRFSTVAPEISLASRQKCGSISRRFWQART